MSGVTSHLLNLTEGLGREKELHLSAICGEANGINLFKNINVNINVNKHFRSDKKSYLNYSKALAYLVRFVKQNETDIIHSHSHYTANLAFHASRHCRIKTIQTNHSILKVKGKPDYFKSGKLIAIDENIYGYLLNNKILLPKDIFFIRCGIHVPALPPQKNPIKIKVLAASGFVPGKELDTFIKAVSRLPEDDRTKAEFCIAGEGELESELKSLNEKLGAGIKFSGRVDDMPSLLRSAHIFVFTSASDTEGFPQVITEAAAYNNLIISSDAGGIESVLTRDIDSLIFKKGDEYDLMIKIKLAIDGYRTFQKMAEHLYYKIKELFGFNTMIQKHKELYNLCLREQ